MKRVKQLSLTLLLLVGSVCGYAYYPDVRIGDFEYSLYDNGKATIKGFSSYLSSEPTDLVIPDEVEYQGKTYRVTHIGYEAFLGCGITSVTLPRYLEKIVGASFEDCGGLQRVVIKDLAAWCNVFIGNADEIVTGNIVEHTTNPLAYAHHLYLNDEEIIDLVIPESITNVNNFAYCSAIKSVSLPNSVTSIGSKAFYGCSGLTSIDFGNSVTTIDENAFYGCTGLTSITIPNSVTTIGLHAFDRCRSLESVTIGNSVTSIGGAAFQYCTALKTINFGSSVATIERYAFRGSGLSSLTIPNTVTSIEKYAFYDCAGLASVNLGKSVTDIGEGVFNKCPNIKKVATGWETVPNMGKLFGTQITECVLEEGVQTIGTSAFENCDSLVSVNIPGSVTKIQERAFYGCKALPSVSIPNSVKTIGKYAFYYCRSFDSLYIPSSVTGIGVSAFEMCPNIHKVTIAIPPLSGMKSYFGSQVTEYVLEEGVNAIGDNAFARCTTLTSITIPNTVTSIGTYAFQDCIGLTSIEIPNSVTNIADKTFFGCKNLVSVTLPNSITSIGQFAFYECTKLADIEIPNSVTSIADHAFARCYGLTSIYIPKSVTSLGQGAFSECTSLSKVTLAMEKIPTYASSNFGNKVKEFVLEEGVKTIDSRAFAYSASMTSISIPSTVTSFGTDAFDGCIGLKRVDITDLNAWCKNAKYWSAKSNPLFYARKLYLNGEEVTTLDVPNSATAIRQYALEGCSSLKRINITNLATWCENGLRSKLEGKYRLYLNGKEVTDLVVPETVTTIGENAFNCCSGLTSAIIPNTVTTINNGAFRNCPKMKTLSIGKSVTSIGTEAFNGCTALNTVDLFAVRPFKIDEKCFSDAAYENATLSVPKGYLLTISTLDYWSNFKTIVEKAAKQDLNGDGNINSADVVVIYNFIVGGEESGIDKKVVDVNGDGDINTADVMAIYNYIINGN